MLISKLKAQQMSFHDYKYRYVMNNKKVLAPFLISHNIRRLPFALADQTFTYHHEAQQRFRVWYRKAIWRNIFLSER